MVKKRHAILALFLIQLSAASAWGQFDRDYIYIVGSSAVYPFARAVAKQTVKKYPIQPPKIEATGTGSGFRQLCAGVGFEYPDINVASRRIRNSELLKCRRNRIDVVELKIGYKAVVITTSKKIQPFGLTPKDIFLALAAKVPESANSKNLIENPYETWMDINPALPDRKILVFGPHRTSIFMENFEVLALEAGAKEFSHLKNMRKKDNRGFQNIARAIRDDNVYIEVADDSKETLHKLESHGHSLAIFSFNFFKKNIGNVTVLPVNGVMPTFDTIASEAYPLSHRMFFYIKKDHFGLIRGIEKYLAELTSETAWGGDGYMSMIGMVPTHIEQRQEFQLEFQDLESLDIIE